MPLRTRDPRHLEHSPASGTVSGVQPHRLASEDGNRLRPPCLEQGSETCFYNLPGNILRDVTAW